MSQTIDSNPEQTVRQIGLIIVGDEILSGKRQDKHFTEVLRLLKERSLALAWVQYLGDDRQRLTATLAQTMASRDIVFCCGGIGATPDDHTRQAAAAAAGQPLALHPVACERITERCRIMAAEGKGSADMSIAENQQRLKMGEFACEASIIENPFNQIPGFSLGDHHFVPGFPVMAWPMIASVLDTRYAGLFGQGLSAERAFWVEDFPESAVTPVMEAVNAAFDGVTVFSLPSATADSPRRHIELGVKGHPDKVDEAFQALRAGIEALGAQVLDEVPQ